MVIYLVVIVTLLYFVFQNAPKKDFEDEISVSKLNSNQKRQLKSSNVKDESTTKNHENDLSGASCKDAESCQVNLENMYQLKQLCKEISGHISPWDTRFVDFAEVLTPVIKIIKKSPNCDGMRKIENDSQQSKKNLRMITKVLDKIDTFIQVKKDYQKPRSLIKAFYNGLTVLKNDLDVYGKILLGTSCQKEVSEKENSDCHSEVKSPVPEARSEIFNSNPSREPVEDVESCDTNKSEKFTEMEVVSVSCFVPMVSVVSLHYTLVFPLTFYEI